MRLALSKRHSLGNEYVVVDARQTPVPAERLGTLGRLLCDRLGPVGADGAAFVLDEQGGAAHVRVFNPSGSESERCLNGLRCAARSLLSPERQETLLQTSHGTLTARLEPPFVDSVPSIDIETPLPVYGLTPPHVVEAAPIEPPLGIEGVEFVPMTNGVPHLIAVVRRIDQRLLSRIGEELQTHPQFPTGMNVSFVAPLSEGTFFIKTFERGGAGLTTACSSALSAAARLLRDRGVLSSDRLTALTSGGPSEVVIGSASLWLRANVTTLFDAVAETGDSSAAIEILTRHDSVEAAAFDAWIQSAAIARVEQAVVFL